MPIMLSPGVMTKELDFSDYVAEASTCIFGVVGGAKTGPLEPTLITTQADFVRIFGTPTLADFGSYSALAVLGNANKMYYKRVVKLPVTATAPMDRFKISAIAAGAIFNGVTVSIDADGDTGNHIVTVTPPQGEPEVFTVVLDDQQAPTYIEKVVNGASKYVEVIDNITGDIAALYTLADGEDGASHGKTPAGDIQFTTKYFDSTLNTAVVELSAEDSFGFFDYQLRLGDKVLENFYGLSVDPDDERFIEGIINKGSQYLTCQFDESTEEDITGKSYVITGGNDGIEGLSATDIQLALEDFGNTEVVDIDILLTPGWSDRNVIMTGITLAENRADCLYIFDPPYGLKAQQVVDWTNAVGTYATEEPAFNSSYAAVYWPWVQINDTYSGKNIWLPPSGYVASQIAYSDRVSEPWFAPAGLNRGRLTKPITIEYSPTKGERDILYGNQNVVNPIINYKNQGLTIWGQKTTQRKYTALNRVNVRRLVNYLKKVITASTAYFVFEPNDEYSWQRWYDMVEPKLTSVKAKRGVYDFLILMDETTVSVSDIDNNRMPGQIKFKPTKTAEFIPLDFMIMPTGASFEEE